MLESAASHYRNQQRILTAGLLAARRARRRSPADAANVLASYQVAAATDGLTSVADMLTEQGIKAPLEVRPVASSLAGVASDGRGLATLLEQAETDWQFDQMVVTQLKDTARVAASMGIAARDQIGYVRVLNPPSCARCAVLAGKWFKWNEGFKRHPRCDCFHVPARETNWHGITSNPDDFFHSLSEDEQDRIFTKAGARAIRDGADMGQVVNARRGMQRAQVLGKKQWTTLEGVTKRGVYGGGDFAKAGGYLSEEKGRRGAVAHYTQQSARLQRPMPETIYALAGENRDEALRLLKAYGYVI